MTYAYPTSMFAADTCHLKCQRLHNKVLGTTGNFPRRKGPTKCTWLSKRLMHLTLLHNYAGSRLNLSTISNMWIFA